MPENTIKPVVFYTFLKCVKTRSRRTGDAPRRLQDPSRSLPKKSCSHLGGVLGASWGVLGRLGASWTRLGGVLGSILDLKILSFFRLFCGVHFRVILGAILDHFWVDFGSNFGPFSGDAEDDDNEDDDADDDDDGDADDDDNDDDGVDFYRLRFPCATSPSGSVQSTCHRWPKNRRSGSHVCVFVRM